MFIVLMQQFQDKGITCKAKQSIKVHKYCSIAGVMTMASRQWQGRSNKSTEAIVSLIQYLDCKTARSQFYSVTHATTWSGNQWLLSSSCITIKHQCLKSKHQSKVLSI